MPREGVAAGAAAEVLLGLLKGKLLAAAPELLTGAKVAELEAGLLTGAKLAELEARLLTGAKVAGQEAGPLKGPKPVKLLDGLLGAKEPKPDGVVLPEGVAG